MARRTAWPRTSASRRRRAGTLFPARQWLDQGTLVAAGSDYRVGQFGAMRSVWGMTTRQTVIGVQGHEHSITYDEAGHTPHHSGRPPAGRGGSPRRPHPGRLADLTVWDRDPARCPSDALRDLSPTHTLLGGLLVQGTESTG